MSEFYKGDKANNYKTRLDNLKNNKVRTLYIEKMLHHKAEKELIDNKAVKNILIIGLGMGRDVAWVKNIYPKAKITGIDINKDYVDNSKQMYGIEGYNIDANDFVFYSKYDLILSFNSLAFIPEIENAHFLKKLCLSLSSKGVLILNYPYSGYFLARRLQKNMDINRYYKYINFTKFYVQECAEIRHLHLTCYSSIFDTYLGTHWFTMFVIKLLDKVLITIGPNKLSQSILMVVKKC